MNVLDPQGPIGGAEKTILLNSLAIMLAIVIPTILVTLGTAWWFRGGNARARYRPGWINSGQIELVVWAIPLMVVILVGGIAWVGSHELDPRKALPSTMPPVKVDVVSLDWKWLFIYPDLGVATVNQLALPVGVPAEFWLTSASVMNSFFIPQLGSQIYSMANMTSKLVLRADKPGQYEGFSAQFSGSGFSDMRFRVAALTPGAFDEWLAAARSSSRRLDSASFDELKKPGISSEVVYGTVSPGLFAVAGGRDH